MPRSDPMTWVASESRWVKRIKGKSYYFAPRKHGIDATEAASRPAMRAWWAGQAAIINSTASHIEKELAKGFLTHFLKLRPVGSEVNVDDIAIAKNLVLADMPNSFVASCTDTAYGEGAFDRLQALADEVANVVVTPVDKSRLISTQIDRWMMTHEAKVAAKKLSPKSVRCYRGPMNYLRDNHGAKSLDVLTREWVEDEYHKIGQSDLASSTRSNYWDVFNAFFNYLDESKLITKPAIMEKLSFPRHAETPVVNWTMEEYQAEYAKSTGLKRLALLLAANCSFYASDMVKCVAFYDAKKGTIYMSRKKTERKARSERLYILWPETVEAMKDCGLLVGAYKKILNFDWCKPLGDLRHTSKSFILNSDQYPHYVKAMTGEVGQTDDEKYYWTMGKLIPAFAYLRECYGFGS